MRHRPFSAKRVRLQPRYGSRYRLPVTSGIRGKRRDVDERCNSRVGAGRRDHRAPVGMTDQDRGVADTAQGSPHAIYIAGVRVESVLRSDYFKSFILQSLNEFAEA